MNDVLSQEEVDALLEGVSNGDVQTGARQASMPGEVRDYDLNAQDRLVRGRLPTLEMINERFARHLTLGLYEFMRREVDVSVSDVELIRFTEYVDRLPTPINLNEAHAKPLDGSLLFVIDSGLMFGLVDNLFGGCGRFPRSAENREFTPTESHVSQLLLSRAFAAAKEAWAPVMELDFSFLNAEVNPRFANIVSPAELVVATVFRIELEGAKGELHIVMPYSMLEPIKDLLDAGVQSDHVEKQERWSQAIRTQLNDAQIEISAVLAETKISLRELLDLQPGDVVPMELPKTISICADQTRLFNGKFGVSHGYNAVKMIEKCRQKAGVPALK